MTVINVFERHLSFAGQFLFFLIVLSLVPLFYFLKYGSAHLVYLYFAIFKKHEGEKNKVRVKNENRKCALFPFILSLHILRAESKLMMFSSIF